MILPRSGEEKEKGEKLQDFNTPKLMMYKKKDNTDLNDQRLPQKTKPDSHDPNNHLTHVSGQRTTLQDPLTCLNIITSYKITKQGNLTTKNLLGP